MGLIDAINNIFWKEQKYESEYKNILQQSINEQSLIANYYYSISFSQIPTYVNNVKNWEVYKKIEFMKFLCQILRKTKNSFHDSNDKKKQKILMASQYLKVLFKSKLELSESDLSFFYKAIRELKSFNNYYVAGDWQYSYFFNQVEFNYLNKELPDSMITVLKEIIETKKNINSYNYKSEIKLDEKIKSFLFHSTNPGEKTLPTYFVGEDGFKDFANNLIEQQNETKRNLWYKLTAIAQKASGGKPSIKYLNEARIIIDALGKENFKDITHSWFNYIINLKESITTAIERYESQEYSYQIIEFLSSINSDAIKGYIWMTTCIDDKDTIQLIGKLAERCFRKIPQKGSVATSLGNSCLFYLSSVKGLDGIAQLSKLKLKVKQNSTLTLIEKYIDEAAKKMDISSVEIEDLAVDDFNLKEFKLIYPLEDYKCVIELTGIGKSSMKWIKKDGLEQKTVPQILKTKYSDKLKKIKEQQKQIDQATSIQKERLDRILRSERKISIEYFKEKYLNHGLLSFVINKIIFNLSNVNESILAIYYNKKWIDLNYNEVNIENFSNINFWHPATSSTNIVREWRQFLLDAQIQQPFKQAYREIYLLTEAEINTKTYSNRMASHILKQHQYVTLAKGRNWKAKLLGAWDGGEHDTAELYLSEYNLKVEYWINALNAEDQYTSSGIWNYVTTDQIRFINSETNELLDLINVPIIAFSEVMRDVDLFVGVASVGNDPTWSDSGGLITYRDYWQTYSFGDLSEIAKNRKEILEKLIPRLKIASVIKIDEKFVVVTGKLRTYKIHIGSTNILMEPNDQYLCIVPDKNLKTHSENIFLPFEGDNGLSIIISKAFLLANDEIITDSTILSQIKR